MKKILGLFLVASITTAFANMPASYTACVTCHGKSGEKSGLNSSEIIKGWSEDKVTNALNGYKNGTYGKKQKALMKNYADKLSDNDIKEIASYLSKQ